MDEHGPPRVVIVGGGFGGLAVARGLARAPVRVCIIDRNNHHLFQPLLYQVATAGLSPADIAAPIRSIVRRQRNTEVRMGEVESVDTREHVVGIGENRVPYDYLVLATGARDSYFGHSGWTQYAPALKSLGEATGIRRRILIAFEEAETACAGPDRDALLTFVLVGGGPTGVELAGAIAELSRKALASDFRHIDPRHARIVLLEAGARILPAFAANLGAAATRALEHLGVEVKVNARVTAVDQEGVEVGSERIRARTVLWAAGVAASPASAWLNADADAAGRVRVGPDLSVQGVPDVFVIGDTATLAQPGPALPGLAPVAMQQGRYVAAVIRARVLGKAPPAPFRYRDKGNLATVGRSFAVLQAGRVRMSGFVAWVIWWAVHIFYLIGFRNRFLVLFQWAWAYLTFQRGARLITADPDAPGARSEHTEAS